MFMCLANSHDHPQVSSKFPVWFLGIQFCKTGCKWVRAMLHGCLLISLKFITWWPKRAVWLQTLGFYQVRNDFSHTKIWTCMFTTWFSRANKWKQPKCPLTDEWMNNTWYYIHEHYSVLKRNRVVQMAEPQKYYAKWKKPNTKEHIIYDVIYIACQEKAYRERQKVDLWLA